MKGVKLRKVVGMMAAVFCAAGVFVALVWKQNTYVRLSKSVVESQQKKTRLVNEVAAMELEVKKLKKSARIEGLAKGNFGLEYALAPILVFGGEQGWTAAGGQMAKKTGSRKPIETGGTGNAWETRGL